MLAIMSDPAPNQRSKSPPVETRTGRNRAIAGLLFGYTDWRGWARAIVAIRATPRQVALGVALGSFIAFTPFMGLQMILAALAATIVGASRKAAMLAVWISNPLTMGPIFAVTYWIGALLMSPETATAGIAETTSSSIRFESPPISTLVDAGWGIMWTMTVGGALVGLAAAVGAYVLTHRGVQVFQSRKPAVEYMQAR